MADDIDIPLASEALTEPDLKPAPSWYRIFKAWATAFNERSATLESIRTITFPAGYTFKFPENETVRLVINSSVAFDIESVSTRTEAGTATVTISINGTPLGGTANSASTSEQTQAHTTANAVAVGDDVEVTFASTSADCENLNITLKCSRDLF